MKDRLRSASPDEALTMWAQWRMFYGLHGEIHVEDPRPPEPGCHLGRMLSSWHAREDPKEIAGRWIEATDGFRWAYPALRQVHILRVELAAVELVCAYELFLARLDRRWRTEPCRPWAPLVRQDLSPQEVDRVIGQVFADKPTRHQWRVSQNSDDSRLLPGMVRA